MFEMDIRPQNIMISIGLMEQFHGSELKILGTKEEYLKMHIKR